MCKLQATTGNFGGFLVFNNENEKGGLSPLNYSHYHGGLSPNKTTCRFDIERLAFQSGFLGQRPKQTKPLYCYRSAARALL
ncbi:hypothetical protein [Helicobacter pylori]|uniref:hypothetical protein n=1 Tax=Helicobacter pylori TaxID=210 RepID=UPI00165CB2CB|nr:hypothetical protein [Helicobacter pylori]